MDKLGVGGGEEKSKKHITWFRNHNTYNPDSSIFLVIAWWMLVCEWPVTFFIPWPVATMLNPSVSYVSDCEVLSICLQSLATVDVSGIQGFGVFYDGDYYWAIACLSWEPCHVNCQLLFSHFCWTSLSRACQGELEDARSISRRWTMPSVLLLFHLAWGLLSHILSCGQMPLAELA